MMKECVQPPEVRLDVSRCRGYIPIIEGKYEQHLRTTDRYSTSATQASRAPCSVPSLALTMVTVQSGEFNFVGWVRRERQEPIASLPKELTPPSRSNIHRQMRNMCTRLQPGYRRKSESSSVELGPGISIIYLAIHASILV